MTKTRKTIGVMVGGITDDFTRFLCKGLRAAAKEQDVNMVVLPGKFLDRDYAQNTDIMYEYQYDTLFSSVQRRKNVWLNLCITMMEFHAFWFPLIWKDM